MSAMNIQTSKEDFANILMALLSNVIIQMH